MANQGGTITASDFNNLKAAVDSEISRRSSKYSVGSMSSYTGSTYKYSVTPNSGGSILYEHIYKITKPLDAVNNGSLTPEKDSFINAIDVINAANYVNTLSSTNAASSTKTCSASCTGLCSTGCYSACSGCSGSCSGNCSDSDCDSGCQTVCSNQCSESHCMTCDGTCQGTCSGDCQNGCTSVNKSWL